MEVELVDESWQQYDINYSHDLSDFEKLSLDFSEYELIKRILTSKLDRWNSEDEVRYMKRGTKEKYMPIKINRVILGYNISKSDKELLQTFINVLNRSYSSDIKISTMKKSSLKLI